MKTFVIFELFMSIILFIGFIVAMVSEDNYKTPVIICIISVAIMILGVFIFTLVYA